ncbi:7674_t:CDS:10 [Acaulospora colombiana]|uniref:7674_t:CDS:1 n=1 Tax=Acaulospora colombiana TaxID=27376 RepID=A0ACA9K0K1_9GLOM|nr:7674_t:CDS:10 [Acaulospora colombiana]
MSNPTRNYSSNLRGSPLIYEPMSKHDIVTAFMDWANTFDNLSCTVNSIHDLSDGNVLISMLCDIDQNWFKLVTHVPENRKENWFVKYDKLKRLYTLLTRYYEEILGLPAKNIESPNLKVIAKDEDFDEIVKLYSLVLTLAIRSSNNVIYIEKIQSLSQKSQEGSDELSQITEEHKRLLVEKEALERAHQTLITDNTELRLQCDDFEIECEELKQKLKIVKSTIAQTSKDGHADFPMKNEIDNLRHELQVFENKRHETELLIDDQNQMIRDLTRKVESLSHQVDEAERLKDQLDEFRSTAEKLKKTQNILEKYKKKLEESAVMRRSLKILEQENKDMDKINQDLQMECRKIETLKSSIEHYKRKIIELQNEKNELADQKEKYERSESKMKIKIRSLEDRLELKKETEEFESADKYDNARVLSVDLEGSTMASLKSKINKIELELEELRESKESKSAELLVLQHQLEDAIKDKGKLEKEYSIACQEKLALENELVRLQSNGSDRSEDDIKSQNIMLLKKIADYTSKVEKCKALITGQHEIIEYYKNNECLIYAERKAHAEEIALLEVRTISS